jgi:NitT/TauT family transport system permease protein
MPYRDNYDIPHRKENLPNIWDLLAFLIGLGVFAALTWNARSMTLPYHLGTTLPITLHYDALPAYAAQTILRMFIAMFFSLTVSFLVAPCAAKYLQAEKILIPLIDVLQSVPVLAFLSISITGFIYLFPGSLLGPECAAIFAIFTSQVWNMTLSLYQSLKTVPAELREVTQMFQLSAWQRFWRLEVPWALPGLLWNMMMSMSAGWFFVVAAEAISVAHQEILLPGIGSYIAVAIKQANMHAVMAAIVTMFIVIVLYDQLLFRPLIKWAEKFKFEPVSPEEESYSFVLAILSRTRMLSYLGDKFAMALDAIANFFPKKTQLNVGAQKKYISWQKYFSAAWNAILFCLGAWLFILAWKFCQEQFSVAEIIHVLLLGVYTSVRVFGLIILCSIIWVPTGVWIGRRPKATNWVQPIAQFFAAFPANLLFPVVVMVIIRFHLNVEVWTTPLMILGSQWYILFNVIAGTAALPKDLYYAIDNLGVRGVLRWKRFILPGIFPYYVTGALTAAGGAWNASIVAEMVSWGNITLKATGLGSYIASYTQAGDFSKQILGTAMMCLFVLLLNRIFWQPLYHLAQKRFGVV